MSTLSERVRRLQDEANRVVRELAQLLEQVGQVAQAADALNAALDAQPPSVLTPTSSPAVSGAPAFRTGYVDPLVWRAAEEEAPKVGVQPETLVAIQVWESAWYLSPLFKTANNVGGVKYRPDLEILGHVHGSYTAKDGNVYAKWPDWRAGIAGHAQFLAQRRYDGIRQTDDVTAEVRAIHEAGYAEMSQEWLAGVTALATRFWKERHP